MNNVINSHNELNNFLTYFPRNDTYTITDINGNIFSVDGQPESYRRWGNSHIYVGYHGNSIIRMESHIMPCVQKIVRNNQFEYCPAFDRIPVNRLVAECWLEDYRHDYLVRRENQHSYYRNAVYNLYMSPPLVVDEHIMRNPMKYEKLPIV